MLFQSEIALGARIWEVWLLWRAGGDRGWPKALDQRVGTRGQAKTCEGPREKEQVSEYWRDPEQEGRSRALPRAGQPMELHTKNPDFFPNVSKI